MSGGLTKDRRGASNDCPTETIKTLVLLCRGLEAKMPGLDFDELALCLSVGQEGVIVQGEEDLCNRPAAIKHALERNSPNRLVLGLCSNQYPEVEIKAYARKVGLDPLGIQVVDLSSCSGNGILAVNRAKVMLAAAAARVEAFPGSKPENIKTVLPGAGARISRRALFRMPALACCSVPTVNPTLCAAKDGCDLCVGVCPHGALERDGDTILVSRAECRSCGVCVATCPQRAVDFPGWSHGELEGQLSTILNAEAELDGRAIAFVCKNRVSPIDQGWIPVTMPCMAMVTVSAILLAVARGIAEVSLQPCSDPCPTGLGEVVRGKVDYCNQLLRELGDPSETDRVRFILPGEIATPQPAGVLPDPPGEVDGIPIRVFGRGTAATVVMDLAKMHGREDLVLAHPYSPIGSVKVNVESCTGCGTCANGCPTCALYFERRELSTALAFDASLCIGCGQCESLCPEQAAGAIEVTPLTDVPALFKGSQVVFQDQEVLCESCGGPVATSRMLERIAVLLGEDYNPQLMARLCTDCRGLQGRPPT